jgi:hypothetical protein
MEKHMTDQPLPHEQLDAYSLARELMAGVNVLKLPKLTLAEITVAGKLQRSTTACFAAIVEAADRPRQRADRAGEALELAMECSGLIDGCYALRVIDQPTYELWLSLAGQLVEALRVFNEQIRRGASGGRGGSGRSFLN